MELRLKAEERARLKYERVQGSIQGSAPGPSPAAAQGQDPSQVSASTRLDELEARVAQMLAHATKSRVAAALDLNLNRSPSAARSPPASPPKAPGR